jgi:hypothetical protein
MDLRQYLCDPASLRILGGALGAFQDGVRRRLVREGYEERALAVAVAELLCEEEGKRVWQTPPALAQFLWRHVRAEPAEVSRYLGLYAELGLEANRKALAALSRLAALAGVERAYEWAGISRDMAPERRDQFLHLVSEMEGYAMAPDEYAREAIAEGACLASEERFSQWMGSLLQVLKRRQPTRYLLAGMRLAAEFSPRYAFCDLGRCDDVPEQALWAIAYGLDDRHKGWIAIGLWEACGHLPGLSRLLAESNWRTMGKASAAVYLRFLADLSYLGRRRAFARKWAVMSKAIPEVERLLVETPAEYREKAVTFADEWFYWSEDAGFVAERLPRGYTLLRRLAAAPFDTGAGARRVVWHFLGLAREQDLERFVAAPDASFEALERECQRDNNAALVNLGTQSLTSGLGKLAVDAFLDAPAKLFRVARKLGSLSGPERSAVVKTCAKNSLVRIDAMRAKLDQVVHVVSARRTSAMANPVPAQLTKWMRGKLTLTPARVERYRRVLAERLVLTRLDLVEQTVVERLKRGLPAPAVEPGEEFALLLLGSVRDNRRGLRKFLNAYWRGDRDYLARHPATAAWYRRRPAVKREVWERGVVFKKAGYSICVEQDPLEVLRLGEYVGSCLGLGGSNSHSAVAALLDANKQVLYARDKHGKVVGRQLVAISDEERLVCFSVYPKGGSVRMKTLFRAYDIAFSEALGLPIHISRELGDGYRIEQVLSQDWYDDYAWDLTIEAEEEGPGRKRGVKAGR